ncbi:type IV pilus assembly protein PilM [Marinospirillum alkaliphilum]|uniref:Type IV pilus assembly protein PilM n=1 Tax=Marinospirillum alkaliphilum DSM 21637 TaxID=1122209 RepID=A0A1K1W4Y2_9GAMM|nr:type IV pilus assembly protein PilM [Marinospirillum alkaliphilum]SFX32489.1 type IV pilus assembly protein PilM [Marinospirillum alkaliphilum DSM 21637]
MLRMPELTFLRPKKLPLIGVDISCSAVKLLEIHPHGDKLQVASYGVAPLEGGAVSDRRIKDYKSVARSIKRVMDRTEPSTTRTAVAVPTANVITRTLSLPRDLDDEEMEAQVLTEADQHIPYPLNEVSIDFTRLPPLNPDDENQPVLLVACRKETTDQLDQVLEEAGLEPVVIDVENYAMERSLGLILQQLPRHEDSQIVAVADVGATMTTLNVLRDGEIIYSRDQIFGGKQLTDEIQRHYGLSREEAGFAKKKGNLPADYWTEILEPFKVAMIQQIERQLQLFYSSSSYHDIDYLVLAGGSSAIEGLPAMAQQQIGSPACVANPFANMTLSDKVNAAALAQDAPAMMIACGLAMRIQS